MDTERTGPGRREARERAIALLYEGEAKDLTGEALLESLPLRPDDYTAAAIVGYHEDSARIDGLISDNSHDWKLDRLPQVDRAILRLGVWELVCRPEVPIAVVINEGVELAKEYSTDKSSSFVNAVLDAVAARERT